MEKALEVSGGPASALRFWVEQSATAIEVLAVAIIAATIAVATAMYVVAIARRAAGAATYTAYRHRVARALLLGLEILVAADIIRTVALEPTLPNILALGLLVLIRTFLSWGLVVEIEGRWPWQARADAPARADARVGADDHPLAGAARRPST